MRKPGLRFVAALIVLLSGCTGRPDGVEPVSPFDINRYQGIWYEIMRLDHSFERGLTNVTATYDLREDGTLVYLWLRPMDRLSVVAGAYLAALTVSLPLTTLPLAAAALVGKATVDGVIATVVAASFGVLAYSAAFVLLGLMIRNPIIWGLAYVLVWEGIFARFSEPVGNAAVRGYTRSLLANLSDVGLGPAAEANTSTAVLVCVFVAAGSLAMAAVRLNRMEVD